ncbi:MAG: glycosyltransferase, partial [Eubacteriales bacterium]
MAGRVLVLSEPFGMGHERAAQALIKCMEKTNPDLQVLHTTSLKCTFPRLTDSLLKLYFIVVNTFPKMWHGFYETSRKDQSQNSRQMVYRLLSAGIKKTIREFRPDRVVCTHPFPAAVISRLKDEGLDAPLTGIITDYDIHAYWLDNNIDLYIIGDKLLQKDFTALDFTPRQVSAQGIPIDPIFGQKADREQLKAKLGLDQNRPMILLAGGGWGLGNLAGIAGMVAGIPQKPQVVTVTGTNHNLKKQLRKTYAAIENIKTEGLVTNIDELMKAADILVTKPGGLTTSEALAAGVPMVLFDVLFGQEVWNARFLTAHDAAVKCEQIKDIPQKVQELLENGTARRQLSEKALALGKPEAG